MSFNPLQPGFNNNCTESLHAYLAMCVPSDNPSLEQLSLVQERLIDSPSAQFCSNVGFWYDPGTRWFEKTQNLSVAGIRAKLNAGKLPIVHYEFNPDIPKEAQTACHRRENIAQGIYESLRRDDGLLNLPNPEKLPIIDLGQIVSLSEDETPTGGLPYEDWRSLDPRHLAFDTSLSRKIDGSFILWSEDGLSIEVCYRNKDDISQLVVTCLDTTGPTPKEIVSVSEEGIFPLEIVGYSDPPYTIESRLTPINEKYRSLLLVSPSRRRFSLDLIPSEGRRDVCRAFQISIAGSCDAYAELVIQKGVLIVDAGQKEYITLYAKGQFLPERVETPPQIIPGSYPEATYLPDNSLASLWSEAVRRNLSMLEGEDLHNHARALTQLASHISNLAAIRLDRGLALELEAEVNLDRIRTSVHKHFQRCLRESDLPMEDLFQYYALAQAFLYGTTHTLVTDLNGTLGSFEVGRVVPFSGVVENLHAYLRENRCHIASGGSFRTLLDEFLVPQGFYSVSPDSSIKPCFPYATNMTLFPRTSMEHCVYDDALGRFLIRSLKKGLTLREVKALEAIIEEANATFHVDRFSERLGFYHVPEQGPGYYRIDNYGGQRTIACSPPGRLVRESREVFLASPENHEMLRQYASFIAQKAQIPRINSGRGGDLSVDIVTSYKKDALEWLKMNSKDPFEQFCYLGDKFDWVFADGTVAEGNDGSLLGIANLIGSINHRGSDLVQFRESTLFPVSLDKNPQGVACLINSLFLGNRLGRVVQRLMSVG